MGYLSLWLSMATITAAGLFLKEATLIVGEASEEFSELPSWMLKLASNPYTIACLFFFVLSSITFTIAMSRLKLSYIMAVSTAIPLVATAVFALLLFDENVSWLGWLGILMTCVGVFVVSMKRSISESNV